MLRQPFSNLAGFLVHDTLRLTKHPMLARYAKILATFLISGLMHLLADLAVGMSFSDTGSVRFFCTQALGIVIEDGVQAVSRSMRGVGGAGWRERSLGYVWVVAFLAWSTPAWLYPAIRLNQGGAKDGILPFSVLRLLLGRE